MRLPRVRFTVRRVIVAVAIVAALLGGGLSWHQMRDEMHRYDEPSFSPDERQAVRSATEAGLNPKGPRPKFDDVFRYMVSKEDNGWLVFVWSVHGFNYGKPQFAPGGYTGVMLDRDFKVTRILPGE